MKSRESALQAWFGTPLGRSFLACERLLVSPLAEHLVGARLLQLGRWGNDERILENVRVGQIVRMAEDAPADMVASLDALPILSESVECVLMPHTLEFHADPHATLWEAARVLEDGGHLLLIGFSRYSLWGLREALGRPPFGGEGHLISERRIGDWMRLLGLELMSVRRYHYRPPLSHAASLRGTRWLERWGNSRVPGPWPAGGYAALFCKRRPGTTPLPAARRAVPSFAPGTVPNGMGRHRSH